jgi:hypothetical protein
VKKLCIRKCADGTIIKENGDSAFTTMPIITMTHAGVLMVNTTSRNVYSHQVSKYDNEPGCQRTRKTDGHVTGTGKRWWPLLYWQEG